MGWNGGEMLLHSPGGTGWPAGSGRPTTFEATGRGATRVGDWLVMHYRSDAQDRLSPEAAAAVSRSRAGGRVVVALWSSAADTYALALAEAGRDVRVLAHSQGEAVDVVGAPLPEEAGLRWDEDPEEALFALVERLTGVDVPSLPGADLPWWDVPFTRTPWWRSLLRR